MNPSEPHPATSFKDIQPERSSLNRRSRRLNRPRSRGSAPSKRPAHFIRIPLPGASSDLVGMRVVVRALSGSKDGPETRLCTIGRVAHHDDGHVTVKCVYAKAIIGPIDLRLQDRAIVVAGMRT